MAPPPTTSSSTRDGIALVLAALRADPTSLALLTAQMDTQAARDAAIFCAYVAAEQFTRLETSQHTPGHYETVLQQLALQVAASPHGTIKNP